METESAWAWNGMEHHLPHLWGTTWYHLSFLAGSSYLLDSRVASPLASAHAALGAGPSLTALGRPNDRPVELGPQSADQLSEGRP